MNDPLSCLSLAERQVIELVLEFDTATTARWLGKAPATVKNQLASIYDKLNVAPAEGRLKRSMLALRLGELGVL